MIPLQWRKATASNTGVVRVLSSLGAKAECGLKKQQVTCNDLRVAHATSQLETGKGLLFSVSKGLAFGMLPG